MAAYPLKMVALCAVLVIILSMAGQQPAMAYDDASAGRSRLVCPSPVTTCRTQCVLACDTFAQTMCKDICSLTQSHPLLAALAQTCVNQAATPCITVCKNLCEPAPISGKTSP